LVSVTVSILPATSFFAPRKSKLACTPPGLDRELGFGQVDLVRGQHELRLRRERVGELEADRRAARCGVDQRRVGEAHVICAALLYRLAASSFRFG
jgi:hypothetical protein